MGPNTVSPCRQQTGEGVSEYCAFSRADVDWSSRVCTSMFNNGLLWSMCLEKAIFRSIPLNRFESQFSESCEVCAEIYVAGLGRLDRFDQVELCNVPYGFC